MEKPNNKDIIPENIKGKKTDTVSEISFDTREEANAHFQLVKERLFNIHRWHDLAGAASASFELLNESGDKVIRPVEKGDYFKINIPGPGSETGEGNDWVQVESIEESDQPSGEVEYVIIKVRPASNPLNSKQDTAHFFRDDASSFFVARRDGNNVSAEVHGRNEVPNTQSESVTDKIRNTIVAIGAILGFSNVQWKSLTEGIIRK